MPEVATPRRPRPRGRAWTSPLVWSLYHELSSEPGNLFFSPYGILGALMVARAGAVGVTRREIDAALERPDANEDLDELFGRLLQEVGRITRPGAGLFELVTANALWCQAGCPVRHSYVETLRARLGAEIGAVDFAGSPDQAARTVNAWVAEVTRGRIPAIVEREQIRSLTRAMLANVVYFKAPWGEPFETEASRPEPFHLPGGRVVDVPTMHRTGDYHYGRTEHAQALQLPYVIWPVRMIVLLPDEGALGAAESDLRPGFLQRLIEEAEPRETRVSLPRCRVESSFRLRGTLERMGIVQAFGPGANFSGISEQEGVFLDDVLHRTFVDVNEYGTEATAATGATARMGWTDSSGAPLEFRVDRPFLFLICDIGTGTVFFTGRVVDPRG